MASSYKSIRSCYQVYRDVATRAGRAGFALRPLSTLCAPRTLCALWPLRPVVVKSKTSADIIYAGAATDGTGFLIVGFNKTGEDVVQLGVDECGNGFVGAYSSSL